MLLMLTILGRINNPNNEAINDRQEEKLRWERYILIPNRLELRPYNIILRT